ncbi:MAG: hypothetical protein CMP73_05570 [Flavobacteriales bacterium]|nr:hypothetical protein [Flavobacteriales bacterium]|tara:strand:- start:720 stop:1457 length:738 start_codon:yes stop_codon:yes gene_type:complete
MKHNIHHEYEKNHWWFKSRRMVMKHALMKIKSLEDKQLLEVGCGTGGNLKYLFKDIRHKHGIEIDEDALKYAKKTCKNSNIFWGDANFLDEIKIKFDIIAFLDVLYHENIINVETVLKKAYGKLNDNGFLILTEPAFEVLIGDHSRTVKAKRRFRRDQLEKKLNKAGFNIVKFSRYWGYLTFVILLFKRRLLEKILPFSLSNEGTDIIHIPFINKFLFWITKVEMLLLRLLNLPFGNSILIIVQK